MTIEKYKAAQGKIVHETIDGEVVIINLETGAYYSLTKAGAHVWQRLVGGASRDELANSLAIRYEESRDAITSSLDALIESLRAEDIIVVETGDTTETPSLSSAPEDLPRKQPFEAPVLTKFSNMSDLLLLDPIHDVDEQGWPNRRAE